jgi:secreted PhoX family phosphatase
VDNVTVAADGTVLVAEDGGDLQVVALAADGTQRPVAQVTGHPFSEITGIAFDPSGTRLYFSSQRGATGLSSGGVTYEIRGPLLG